MSIIPVYNRVLVPGTLLVFKTEEYTGRVGRQPYKDEEINFIVLRSMEEPQPCSRQDFYPVAISGRIVEPDESGIMSVRLGPRLNLEDLTVYRDQTLSIRVTRRPDIEDLGSREEEEALARVKEAVLDVARDLEFGGIIRGYVQRWDNLGDVASAMSQVMSTTNEECYAILAEDSRKKRNDLLEKMIMENIEMIRLNRKAQYAQQEDQQKIYRESAIRRQMEFLQKELDDMHPESLSDLRRLERRLEEAGMNEEALKEGRKVLSRLKNENQNSPETGLLTDYLELLTSLPWRKEPARKIELEEARKILEADHFGLDKVKKRVIQQIAVMNLRGQQSGSILLFVGAPGTGKTSIGQSIARALGREYVRVSLGGIRDEADIRGHRRTYIGSMPGRIIDGIRKSGVSNPVMVLDEVDKLSQSYNGDPASALLEVLDPEQNATFTDHYLNVPYDLSDVFFICTANSTDTIPEPLLNRMEVISFQGYTPLEKQEIARLHLLPRARKAVGLREEDLEVTPEAIDEVITCYTRESGVRGLKKQMDTICRNAAVRLVEGRDRKVRVDAGELKDYLDHPPLRHRKVPEGAAPGVVTGLAWTPAGGEILFIETLRTNGTGRLTVTGQLGDVMKESAQIALTLVRSLFPGEAEALEKQDLHIHVPDGATPKDGPSAGITLVTALSSLLCGVGVPPDTAMTGEVSLQGRVSAIGGLTEKLMAAQRAGVRRVFIPEDNLDDLEEVPEEIRGQMEILPVKEVCEVLEALSLQESGKVC